MEQREGENDIWKEKRRNRSYFFDKDVAMRRCWKVMERESREKEKMTFRLKD